MSRESRVMTRLPWVICVLETCLISAADEKFSDFGSRLAKFRISSTDKFIIFSGAMLNL